MTPTGMLVRSASPGTLNTSVRRGACAAVMFLLIGAACRPTPSTDNTLASLRVRVQAQPRQGYDPGPKGDMYADAPASTPSGYGDFERVNYHDLEDVVVWLEPVDQAANRPPPADTEIEIPQYATSVVPPLHVIGVGGTLVLRNARDAVATVYSLSEGNEFTLGNIAIGASARHTVSAAGEVELMCETLANPIARILIAPTAWVRQVRGGGNAIFDRLPPGSYTVVCWHPRLPGDRKEVRLSADNQEWVELTVGVRGLPIIP